MQRIRFGNKFYELIKYNKYFYRVGEEIKPTACKIFALDKQNGK